MHAAVRNRSFACKLNCSNTQLPVLTLVLSFVEHQSVNLSFQVQDGNSWLNGTKCRVSYRLNRMMAAK